MHSTNAAFLEFVAGKVNRRSALTEMVRRRGDKVKGGKQHGGFSTFSVTSGGGKEEEGTAYKAKTADGKVVPIIMRGEAGKGGTAEVIVPGDKRYGLSIPQASKLRQNISLYDLADVPKVVKALRANKPLPEHEELDENLCWFFEKAPPGWAGTVKAMKKHMAPDKAFALAWHGHKTGKKPHYKDDGSTTNGKEPEKKKKYQDEGFDVEKAKAELAANRKAAEENLAKLNKLKKGDKITIFRKKFTVVGNHGPRGPKNKVEISLAGGKGVVYLLTLPAEAKYMASYMNTGGRGMPRPKNVSLNDIMLEGIELEEGKDPKLKPNQSVTFKTVDMGNNESKGIAITFEQDGTFTAMSMARSKGGFKTYPGAKKWLEKQVGKKLVGGVVEMVEQNDTTFIADPSTMQTAIAAKLGLSNFSCSSDVMAVITSMYAAKEVPAAVYATAAGMARVDQRASAANAKVMNQMGAEELAGAIMRGVAGTSSPTIKSAEKWWMGEIGSIGADRRPAAQNTVTVSNTNEIQPYIDSMATGSVDEAFEAAAHEVEPTECDQPIGSGALTDLSAIDIGAGYERPGDMPGSEEDLSAERTVDRGMAVASIRGGKPHSNTQASVVRNAPSLPGTENRINPGQYTAEDTMSGGRVGWMPPPKVKSKVKWLGGKTPKVGGNISFEDPHTGRTQVLKVTKIDGTTIWAEGKGGAAYSIVAPSSGSSVDPENVMRWPKRRSSLPANPRFKKGSFKVVEYIDDFEYEERLRLAEVYDRFVGGAQDLSKDELVDVETYKAMVLARSSNPVGTSTPVATMDRPTTGRVEVNDVDTAFEMSIDD